MMKEKYAEELYEALKDVLEAIPIIAGDSRHDELTFRIHESDKLSECAPELYETLKNVLEAIPIIAGDSRHDELALRIQEADKLIREIEKDEYEEKLKPCPSCGGDDVGIWYDNKKFNGYRIFCKGCGGMSDSYDTSEEARAAWNRMAVSET